MLCYLGRGPAVAIAHRTINRGGAMKRLGYVAVGLMFIAAALSVAAASQRLVLFEYFSNTG
jgi:hypothetical protein